jgi:hypothetical protein
VLLTLDSDDVLDSHASATALEAAIRVGPSPTDSS